LNEIEKIDPVQIQTLDPDPDHVQGAILLGLVPAVGIQGSFSF